MSIAIQPLSPDLVLPWSPNPEQEKKFKNGIKVGSGLLLLFFVLFNALPLLDIERKVDPKEIKKTTVILKKIERKKPKPVVTPPPVEKPKPVVAQKKPAPKKPKVAAKKPQKKVAKSKPKNARAAVSKSQGLASMRSQLSALRGSINTPGMTKKEALRSKAGQKALTKRSALGEAQATSARGGGYKINNNVMKSDPNKLAAHNTKAIQQVVAIDFDNESASAGSYVPGSRDMQSIREIIERHKGSIYALYHQSLNGNPDVSGTYIFKAVILPNGNVSDVRLVSSELGVANLDRAILSKIKAIKFGRMEDVKVTEVTYKFHFAPSS